MKQGSSNDSFETCLGILLFTAEAVGLFYKYIKSFRMETSEGLAVKGQGQGEWKRNCAIARNTGKEREETERETYVEGAECRDFS